MLSVTGVFHFCVNIKVCNVLNYIDEDKTVKRHLMHLIKNLTSKPVFTVGPGKHV